MFGELGDACAKIYDMSTQMYRLCTSVSRDQEELPGRQETNNPFSYRLWNSSSCLAGHLSDWWWHVLSLGDSMWTLPSVFL